MAPRKRNRASQENVYYIAPTAPQYPQFLQQQQPLMPPQQVAMMEEYEMGNAANALCTFAHDLRRVQLSMKRDNSETKVFVHRDGPDLAEVKPFESDVRSNRDLDTHVAKKVKREHDIKTFAVSPHAIQFSHGDIIFANGNNREKRRGEVFEYYSELHKYKERNRQTIYQNQRAQLLKDLSENSKPRLFVTEDGETNAEQDLVEQRDLELTRLRHWRRYQRNENVKLYYEEVTKVYKEAMSAVDKKLEKLKHFFLSQRQVWASMEKDLTDISSNRSEKLYTDTDLTTKDFYQITAEQPQGPQRGQPRGQPRGQNNTSESESDRRREHRDGHMNKIMKRYTGPDELDPEAVEGDLVLLRSLS
jgi:hypothetical protein